MDKISEILNKNCYWESGYSTYEEIKQYFELCKDHFVVITDTNAEKLGWKKLDFNLFKWFLKENGVYTGYTTINGKRKHVWLNIAPNGSER